MERAAVHTAGPDRSSDFLILAFAPLDKRALGVACGVVSGLLVFVVTALEIGTHPVHSNLALLGQFFWGYTVSWKGAVVGLLWGGVAGFLAGWIVAFVRNFTVAAYLLLIRSEAEAEKYGDFLDHL